MTRRVTVSLAMILIALVILLDIATSDLNPFDAPSAFALGSGAQGGGAFCGELPE